MSWNLLHALAWVFGLKAAIDLQAESPAGGRAASRFTWAIAHCLTMELAILAAPRVAGFELTAALTGAGAALLLAGAIWRLRAELGDFAPEDAPVTRSGRQSAVLAGAVVAGPALHALDAELAARLARVVALLEGALWIAVPLACLLLLATPRFRAPRAQAYGPAGLAAAAAFALLGALVTPVERLRGARFDAPVHALLGTLFVLTLVTTLYATLLRLRGRNLSAARERLAEHERHLLGVEKLVAVGTLAAGAAHDFNNSLSVILGYLELELDDPTLPSRTRERLQQVERAARAATTHSNQLLGLARRRSASTYATLREAVEEPLAVLAGEWRRHGIEVRQLYRDVETAPEIDLALLSHVCLNLYLNARDAMAARGGGVLEVTLERGEAAIELRVRDSGGGIPPEVRERLFTPFVTSKGEHGTGLGLATSRAILAAMGGRIEVERSDSSGTLFLVELPLAVSVATAGVVAVGVSALSAS